VRYLAKTEETEVIDGVEVPRCDPESSILEGVEILRLDIVAAITGKRWLLWTTAYTEMDKAELIRKMRAAMKKIKFMPPLKPGE